jgi:hypothetical protein
MSVGQETRCKLQDASHAHDPALLVCFEKKKKVTNTTRGGSTGLNREETLPVLAAPVKDKNQRCLTYQKRTKFSPCFPCTVITVVASVVEHSLSRSNRRSVERITRLSDGGDW